MERAQQLAHLRQELRDAFPNSMPSIRSDGGLHVDFAGLSSGVPGLDRLLAGQGFPKGRISELTGTISAGKTSLSLQLVAQCTQQGMPVAWIDANQAFYPPAARQQGVVLERLLLLQPTDLPGALKAADILLRGQAFPLVVFDWTSDPPDGAAPLDVGAAIARLNGLCALSETVLLFLTTPRTAREPLRYYATVRLELQREQLPYVLSRTPPANQVGPQTTAHTNSDTKDKLPPAGARSALSIAASHFGHYSIANAGALNAGALNAGALNAGALNAGALNAGALNAVPSTAAASSASGLAGVSALKSRQNPNLPAVSVGTPASTLSGNPHAGSANTVTAGSANAVPESVSVRAAAATALSQSVADGTHAGGAPALPSTPLMASAAASLTQATAAALPSPLHLPSRTPTRPRLVGITQQSTSTAIIVSLVKNKLGAPGGRCEVRLDGAETHRMPLHPGLPDTSPSQR